MTNTQQSVRDMGEKHAREGQKALPRNCFDSDEFYRLYMDGYNSYKPKQTLGPVSNPFESVPFAASGKLYSHPITSSGTGYYLTQDKQGYPLVRLYIDEHRPPVSG